MLGFEINDAALAAIGDEFAATPAQIELSLKRARIRTAATVRRLSSSGLKSELGLRNTKALRKRIKEFRRKRGRGADIKVWYGVNDLPLSAFKGRPREVPEGVRFGDTVIHGAFLAKRGGRRGVFQRLTDRAFPIAEAGLPVADRMMAFIEDKVFVDINSIFFKHFASEIRARTIYGVGNG